MKTRPRRLPPRYDLFLIPLRLEPCDVPDELRKFAEKPERTRRRRGAAARHQENSCANVAASCLVLG
jgi:hypothetical protein